MNWIACKDELPIAWANVLVYVSDDGGYWTEACLTDKGKWYSDNLPFSPDSVTHWMFIAPPDIYSDDSDPSGGPFVAPNSPC